MSLKKLISIALAVLMLALCACEQQVPETSTPDITTEPTTEEPPKESTRGSLKKLLAGAF